MYDIFFCLSRICEIVRIQTFKWQMRINQINKNKRSKGAGSQQPVQSLIKTLETVTRTDKPVVLKVSSLSY